MSKCLQSLDGMGSAQTSGTFPRDLEQGQGPSRRFPAQAGGVSLRPAASPAAKQIQHAGE